LSLSLSLSEEETEAEDIVQEALLRLWRIRGKLDGYRSVEALAMTVTKNVALDRMKVQRPTTGGRELPEVVSGDKSPDELLAQADAADYIHQLISRLPSLQQTVIRMKDVEGYELSEIAEITGSRIETVRVNLSRARKKIREQFIALNKESLWI
ncbi:MAG: sigma-70 family RNA polymerase sigma factor, partial [Tannerellaceae bacterium]|jgi:RNA polymerase sigma-70 factor (ECF subfamily)|nr:sigma-70 family RNA polymerase sigma factor [Tannerellaceae bacterium]